MPKIGQKATKGASKHGSAQVAAPRKRIGRPNTGARITEREARRRKEVALAELRELEVRQKRGELLDAAAVERRWSEALAGIRDRILALPDRLGAVLAGRPEGDVRVILRQELEEALRSASAAA